LVISLLFFIYVSGYKNKKGFVYFSIVNKVNIKDNYDNDFLYWFSGFTDAEGNFLIILDRQYVKFRFKISLHKDDVKVLYLINSKLKIGRVIVENDRNRCSFIVENYSDIKNVICPLFKIYPLHTSKKLDFNNFYEAVLLKEEKNLSNLERIKYLKNSMNFKREIFTYNTEKSQIIINPNWFIGFLEGEGTFGIKTGSSLYLQVAQKTTSQESLNAIIILLTGLSNNTLLNSKILPLNIVSSINVKTNVISLVVSSVDALYYYILPLLNTSKMYTRKTVDFKLWRLALLLKIHGYYYLPEGKKLFLDISDIINKRYSTNCLENIDNKIADIFERSVSIFEKDPPFDVKTNIPHVDNVREFSIKNRSKNPKTVYIYTNNGMIEGSPFVSFSAAHKALGLNPSSNTCNRYIDTNRLYKNKYIFSSNPIDRTSRN
jgi:hypothetical protein